MYICNCNKNNMATNNYYERIIEVMRHRGITKSELGERMGVKKQNVNVLLETNNIEKLLSIANHLGVSLNDLIEAEQSAPEVKGCVVYKGIVHPINCKQDILDILEIIDDSAYNNGTDNP